MGVCGYFSPNFCINSIALISECLSSLARMLELKHFYFLLPTLRHTIEGFSIAAQPITYTLNRGQYGHQPAESSYLAILPARISALPTQPTTPLAGIPDCDTSQSRLTGHLHLRSRQVFRQDKSVAFLSLINVRPFRSHGV